MPTASFACPTAPGWASRSTVRHWPGLQPGDRLSYSRLRSNLKYVEAPHRLQCLRRFTRETFRLGHVAALIVWIGRITAHRAGGNHCERRLRLLTYLHERARCLALLDPLGQHL